MRLTLITLGSRLSIYHFPKFKEEMRKEIFIFCDGGIGNRINALASGLALATHFDLEVKVYWPINTWCGAPFQDIFQNALEVRTDSLNSLAGKYVNAKMMLHDEMGAQFLQVPFESAYAYQSLEDFAARGLSASEDIFFYPAVIPEWIPAQLINDALRSLQISAHIADAVRHFISTTFNRPFHGLHLRRTDLRVGLTDSEVLTLVQRYPNEVFFVCSDDPQAEALAVAHPHVHARPKAHHVEKQTHDSDWISLSKDQEGRVSYGNIQRSREAMIEGTIDLLILAHSEIVGFSGSTFQRMARLLGDVAPLVPISRPARLPYFSFVEMTQQIERQLIEPLLLTQVCQTMAQNGDNTQALELMRLAFERMSDPQRADVAHNLGVMLLNHNLPRQAELYLNAGLAIHPQRYSSWLHLAYVQTTLAKNEDATESFKNAIQYKPPIFTENETILEKLLFERFNF